MSPMALPAVRLFCFLGPMLPPPSQVWIVDPSGSGQFTDIQQAVSGASDGDVILVRSGQYSAFTIDGKSLRVLADVGATVEVYGTVAVRHLAASGSVVLGGIEGTGFYADSISDPGLTLESNLGFVRIERCTFIGGYGIVSLICYEIGDGGDGAHVEGSSYVVFASCTLVGGAGGFDWWGNCDGGAGGNGGSSNTSTVALYDCTVRGGPGGWAEENYVSGIGGRGGQGWRHIDQQLFASRTAFWGGSGGDQWRGGDGGDALEVQGAEADLRSCIYRPGHGNPGHGGGSGQDGHAQVGTGVFNTLSGIARIVSGPLLVADTGTMAVTVYGLPGDRVWFPSSPVPAQSYIPRLGGVRLIHAPTWMSLDPQGTVPASGQLDLQLPVLPLPSGTQVQTQFFQCIVKTAIGETLLCGPMHPTVFRCSALSPDCNANGQFDTCDILNGTSQDCDGNGIPNECEPDCNANGQADACDILNGTSQDCDGNGVPDECDPDCNANGHPDACDISNGTSMDANGNGIPDECEATHTWYVDASASAGGDGSSLNPFRAIGEGIAHSITGDTIIVRDGLYTGAGNRHLGFGGRGIVVQSEHGSTACIIDCQHADGAFWLDQGESSTARIEGFTIENGGAYAAAIYIAFGSPTISNCVVEGCIGGGLQLEYSDSEVGNSSFLGNSRAIGGGLVAEEGSPRIHHCLFEGNDSTSSVSSVGGGAAYVSTSGLALLSHCRILGNHAAMLCGGIYGAGVRIDDCLIAGNTAAYGSAVFCAPNGSVEILDSTLVDNAASTSSTLYVLLGADLRVANSVLWGNTSADNRQATLWDTGASLTVSYCEFQGGQGAVFVNPGATLTWGAGNLNADPLFVDPDGPDNNPLTLDDNDYRLGAVSPCLDAGDNFSVPPDLLDLDGDGNTSEPVPFDLDGNLRFVDQPAAPDVGNGTPPLVDMGCYERP